MTTPVKIGIVGLNFGRWIIEDLLREENAQFFKIAAVCDFDETKAKCYAERLGVKAYTSVDQLLADRDITVVGLYTGPVKRSELLRTIIRAGKDVMTTKPFELDPIDAQAVLEEAKVLGRTIHLNSPSPAPPNWIQQIQTWQREYDLGRPIGAHADVVVSYREQADGTWYDNPKLCPAAPAFRLGIYLINDLVRLFGAVEQVQVFSSRIFTGRPTADNAQLSLVFKNKALASIFASFCVDDGQAYADAFWMHFERGTVYRNTQPVAYAQANVGSRLKLVAKTGEKEVTIQERKLPDEGMGYQWNVLHAAVTGQPTFPMPIDDILQGVKIVEAMTRAQESGKPEYVMRTE
ncbi:MAG: Gfo/Idh/MocA family protein [Chthoniobacteraceae bacterium]